LPEERDIAFLYFGLESKKENRGDDNGLTTI